MITFKNSRCVWPGSIIALWIVAQCIKPLLVSLASCIRGPVQIPAALFPIQLSATVPRKAFIDGSTTWVPATCVGDLDGTPGHWLLGPLGGRGDEPTDSRVLSPFFLSLCLWNKYSEDISQMRHNDLHLGIANIELSQVCVGPRTTSDKWVCLDLRWHR